MAGFFCGQSTVQFKCLLQNVFPFEEGDGHCPVRSLEVRTASILMYTIFYLIQCQWRWWGWRR